MRAGPSPLRAGSMALRASPSFSPSCCCSPSAAAAAAAAALPAGRLPSFLPAADSAAGAAASAASASAAALPRLAAAGASCPPPSCARRSPLSFLPPTADLAAAAGLAGCGAAAGLFAGTCTAAFSDHLKRSCGVGERHGRHVLRDGCSAAPQDARCRIATTAVSDRLL